MVLTHHGINSIGIGGGGNKFILDIPNFDIRALNQDGIQFGTATGAVVTKIGNVLNVYGSWFTCKWSQFNSNRIKFKSNALITSKSTYSYIGLVPFQLSRSSNNNYICCTSYLPSNWSSSHIQFYVNRSRDSEWGGPGGIYYRYALPEIPAEFSNEYQLIVELDGHIAKGSINGIHICDITYDIDCIDLQSGYSDPFSQAINVSTDGGAATIQVSKYEVYYGANWRSEIQ